MATELYELTLKIGNDRKYIWVPELTYPPAMSPYVISVLTIIGRTADLCGRRNNRVYSNVPDPEVDEVRKGTGAIRENLSKYGVNRRLSSPIDAVVLN